MSYTVITSLNDIEMTHTLGQSINSLVFTAKLRSTNNLVKVKQFKPSRFFDPDIVMDEDKTEQEMIQDIGTDRLQLVTNVFMEAGEKLKLLEHPILAKVVGVLVPSDSFNFGIVTEYFEGQTLQQILKNEHSVRQLQAIPVTTRLNWVAQLAEALSYLHKNGILHRNLQKANIVINMEKGTIKLTDYYSQLLSEADQEQEESDREEEDDEEEEDGEREEDDNSDEKEEDSNRRMLNVSKLVDFDAPPELRLRQGFSAESDIYCLAVLAWQLLACEVPFGKEKDRFQLKKQVLGKTQLRPSLDKVRAALSSMTRSDAILEKIQQGWTSDRRARPSLAEIHVTFSS